MACIFAVCSAAVKRDAGYHPQFREKMSQCYAAQAIDLLSRARDGGFFEGAGRVALLDKDADLASLRERDDFRDFVATLKPAMKPPR